MQYNYETGWILKTTLWLPYALFLKYLEYYNWKTGNEREVFPSPIYTGRCTIEESASAVMENWSWCHVSPMMVPDGSANYYSYSAGTLVKKEAASSYETLTPLFIWHGTSCHIPADCSLHKHRCENFRFWVYFGHRKVHQGNWCEAKFQHCVGRRRRVCVNGYR
jgi:hypothetical protein